VSEQSGPTPVRQAGWRAATLLAAMLLAPAAAGDDLSPASEQLPATPALELNALSDLDGVIAALADHRVVFVGEQHDRYEHHLTQLEIIRRLHQQDPRLVIGMEAFQQPFQSALDAYIAGEISEQELLRDSEYYARWRFDYRLYAPILRYAREHGLPVVALNLPEEVTRQVGRGGIQSLSESDRNLIPAEIDRSDSDYEQRLLEVFNNHPRHNGQGFDHFVEVQLLWDEGMAQRAADYLQAHPDQRMVVLAGSGHLAYGSGIPERLLRRLPVSSAIVLNGWQGSIAAGLADFLLFPEQRALPPAGRLGAMLDGQGDEVRVSACQSDSPCETAGLKAGDRLQSIDDQPIEDMVDLRLAMWDKNPGDQIVLEISRKRWIFPARELQLDIELQDVQ
jgi:uncharacterized iron-regulated protein